MLNHWQPALLHLEGKQFPELCFLAREVSLGFALELLLGQFPALAFL